jgi:hypothetical protein
MEFRARWYNKSCKVHVYLRYSNIFGITEFAHCWITIIENYYPILSFTFFILSLSLLTMSYVDKKIDHIFVRNTFLFACDKWRRSRSIAVQGENNRLFCPASMTSLWHVRKRDRRGSITNRYGRDGESQWKT